MPPSHASHTIPRASTTSTNKKAKDSKRWSLTGRARTPPPPAPRPSLSQFSSGSVADSSWASCDFMLGVGMVIIQRNTHKIVLVWEPKLKYWFFPRGRKDMGETLEHAALREAYEESGYRTEFLPLYHLTRQPTSPGDADARNRPNVEPIYITFKAWEPRKMSGGDGTFIDAGGEYITTWYAGQIPEDAVKEVGTGMPDEQHYQSHLLTYEEAMERVWGQEIPVLQYVWNAYQDTLQWEAHLERERLGGRQM